MLFDYHMHSNFSADSTTSMEQQIIQAETRGLDEICFTEHMEYDFHLGAWHADILAQHKYYNEMPAHKVRLKLGAEVGVSCSNENIARLRKEVQEYNLDFVLLSLHQFHNTDPIHEDLFAGNDYKVLLKEYFSELYARMRIFGADSFSALAHIDYMAKGYGKQRLPEGRLKYCYAEDEIDAIFKYLIEHGKCIEINTSTYRGITDGNFPGLDWLKRYHDLGGDYVTIGADAHSPEYVGFCIEDAMALAKEAGIRYIATFDKMKPIFHKI